jgi:hypothetical protein
MSLRTAAVPWPQLAHAHLLRLQRRGVVGGCALSLSRAISPWQMRHVCTVCTSQEEGCA